MKTLHLNLKGEYFDDIKSGDKKWEYRLCNEYWKKRLTDKSGKFKRFDNIMIKRGYPAKGDLKNQIERPFEEIKITDIVHPHFDKNKSVEVFAIRVNRETK